MDTPTYPPATAFEAPTTTSHSLSVDSFSLAELMKLPAAWAIVVKHLPSLQRMVHSPMIKPHLGNFTVRTLETFVMTVKPETYAAINEDLSRLPPVQDVAP